MVQTLMGRLHKLSVYATYPLTSDASCTIFSLYVIHTISKLGKFQVRGSCL